MVDTEKVVTKLFRRHERDLRTFLRRRLWSVDDVEDVLQDTFIKALTVTDWSRIENCRAYLLRTALNLVNDRLRRKHMCVLNDYDDIESLELDSQAPSPETAAIVDKEYRRLCGTVMRLRPQVRRAFVLNRFLGMTYKEVAEVMRISHRTVEKHVGKGLTECRYRMLEWEEAVSVSRKFTLIRGII